MSSEHKYSVITYTDAEGEVRYCWDYVPHPFINTGTIVYTTSSLSEASKMVYMLRAMQKVDKTPEVSIVEVKKPITNEALKDTLNGR